MTAIRGSGATRGAHPAAVPHLAFGIVTDCHYADIDTRGTRHYRASREKLAQCVARMNETRVDFLIELGDFKDQGATAEKTLDYLHEIESIYARFTGPRYHVLGNHDMDRISKSQFLAAIHNTGIAPKQTFYSFDCRGFHAVVLDANYLGNGADYNAGNFDWREAYVPPSELTWLKRDLAKTQRPVVVFIHQLLDGDEGGIYVRNAAQVRAVLETSQRVHAVFQGHHHPGSYRIVNNIHYYTLRGMIEGPGLENSAFAVVEAQEDGSLSVQGSIKATSRHLAREGSKKGGGA